MVDRLIPSRLGHAADQGVRRIGTDGQFWTVAPAAQIALYGLGAARLRP